MPERTAEQTILFELARSKQLRESSHTTTEENPGALPGKPPVNPAMIPNPNYQGLSGIFNQINDALSGKYQAQVKK